jgi:hypothetical protein
MPTGEPKLIRDILFDKEEACENEPVTVRLNAHDPDGKDGSLFVSSTTGAEGNPMVLTFSSPGDYPLMFIVNNGRGAVEQQMRSFKVKDCGRSFAFAELNVRRLRVPDVVAFFARPYYDGKSIPHHPSVKSDAGAPAVAPRDPGRVTFFWDFGDGTAATTSDGYVEHDYVDRPQDRRQSSFLVRAEARSEYRGTAVGILTITFLNVHYLNRVRGLVAPLVLPGLVTRQDSDFVMPVTIRNPDSQTLPITRLTAGLMPCAPPSGRTSVAPLANASYQEVIASSVLGTDSLPPGEIQLDVRFPAHLVQSGICQVYLWGAGQASGGNQLDLQVSMMVTPPTTAPLDMNDPEQARYFEKVRRAAELLGRTRGVVTGEDIMRLEQQGKL